MNYHRREFKEVIRITSAGIFILGVTVLFGWVMDIAILKSFIPDYPTMKFNAALGFSLSGISLYLISTDKGRTLYELSKVPAIAMFVLGGLTLSQEIFNMDLGIDQLFVPELSAIEPKQAKPGRMSPLTAFCLCLTGVSFIGISLRHKAYHIGSQVLLNLVTLLSFIAILGYLFNVPAFYKLSFLTAMAVHTALAIFILSSVASLVNPSLGITGLFTGRGIGSKMARILFTQLTGGILVLAYLRIVSHRTQAVSVEFGIALFALSFILVSLFLIWRTSRELDRIEKRRLIAEGGLAEVSAFLNATPDPILIVDGRGVIQVVNDQTERIFGFKKEKLIGKPIEKLLPDRFRSIHVSHRSDFAEHPKARNMGSGLSLFALKKDGSEVPVEISLNPVTVQNEIWVSAAIRDITERQRAERELKESEQRLAKMNRSIEAINRELKQKNDELEQFAHVAAHDLQSPLRMISNFLLLLQKKYNNQLDDKAREYIKFAVDGAFRMRDLIHDILEFSKTGFVTNKELDLNEIVNGIIQSFKADEKYRLSIVQCDRLPVVHADATAMHQLFTNLIGNGLKYQAPGSIPAISITVEDRTDKWLFRVADNGIGINSKYYDKVFTVFQRLHGSTSEYSGTGIGLATCKKVVSIYNGDIWIEPNQEQGTIFNFTLSK